MNLTINLLTALEVPFNSPVLGEVNGTSFSDSISISLVDNTTASIVIPFTNTNGGYTEDIKVYTEDLIINVILTTPVSLSSPLYKKPTPYLTSIRNPYTGSYDFYNTSTAIGESSFYIDNIYTQTGRKYTHTFKSAGQHSVKVREKVENELCVVIWDMYKGSILVGKDLISDSLQSPSFYLSEDEVTNFFVEDFEPTITINTSSPSKLSGEEESFAIGDQVQFTTSIIPKTEGNWDLNLSVTSPSGESLYDENYLNQTEVDLQVVSSQYVYFPIESEGEYKILVSLINTVTNQEYFKEFNAYAGNIIAIDYITCNSYKITNRGFNLPSITLEITNYSTGKVLNDTTYTLAPNESIELDFNEGIGIYTLVSSIDNSLIQKEWKSIVNTFCEIEDCITDYITSLLCEGCDTSKNVNEYLYDYTKIHTLLHVYHSKLQQEFGFNNVYTGFDIEKLNSLTEIQDIVDILSSICSCSSWSVSEEEGCGKEEDCGCGCS